MTQLEATPRAEMTATGYGLLNFFPHHLQKVIVHEVLESKCERATDIWSQDKETGQVLVLRNDMQWQLNPTASKLWVELKDKSVRSIVDQFKAAFPDVEREEIELQFAEFVLQAASNNILSLIPQRSKEKK